MGGLICGLRKEVFDEADASLLEYASEKEYFVVSEDP